MKTQKEVVEFLKEFWKVKSFEFEAQFNINPKSGKGNFWDIKNPKTKENLLNPESQQPLKVGAPDGIDFEIGKYYLIKLFVPNDDIRSKFGNEYLLFVDTKSNPPQEIKLSPYEFVQQINTEYSSAKGIAKDTLAGAVKRISYDINRKPETFIFELLQNADDYPDKNKEKVNVRFVIKNNLLIVSHNGLPFSPANVRAICSVDAGNKQFDMNKTGYKGIGFKSIFKFSNYVIVNSGGFTFRFDEFYHKKRGNETFWQLIPIWTTPEELPRVYNHPQFTAPNVSFCIRPSKSSVTLEDIQAVFKEIFKDERVLLFLRHVTSIDFSGLDGEGFTHAVSKSKWEVSDLLEVEVNASIRETINRQIKEQDGRVPDKFQDIENSTIRFATSLNEGKVTESVDTKIFAYLPTDVNLGLPFLINGDFIPDGSRQSIHMDLEWNQYLFEEAGKQFLYWLQDLSEKYKRNDFLQLIPDFGTLIDQTQERDKKLFLEKFHSGFEEFLPKVAFLPDLEAKLRRIDELIIDTSGLLELLGEIQFREFMSITKPILHSDFGQNKGLIKLFRNYQSENIINEEIIKELLTKKEVITWLGNIDNSVAFVKFLNERKLLSDHVDQKIFLDQSGDLKVAKEIYFDFDTDAPLLDWLNISKLHEKLAELKFLKLVVKNYQPISFIKEEILLSADAKKRAEIFENNKKFLVLLLKYHDQLNEKEFFEGFKTFPVFDRNGKVISSVSSPTPSYLKNEELVGLMGNGAIPLSLLNIIDSNHYFDLVENTNEFWKKLGVHEWNESIYLGFVKYLFKHSKELHDHYEKNIIDDTAFCGNALFWSFVDKTYLKVPQEAQKEYVQNASSFPVIAKDGQVKPLKDCYLSAGFTNSDALEKLQTRHPEAKMEFVSDGYLAYEQKREWAKIFRLFKVKTDSQDFIKEYIIPKINLAEGDDYLTYTQLLFENRDKFKEEIQQIAWKVKVISGEFISTKYAVLGKYYAEDSKVEDVIRSIKPKVFVSPEYAKSNLKNWADFFIYIGVACFLDEISAIKFKISRFLISQHLFQDENIHSEIVKDLYLLYQTSDLSKEQLENLKMLKLKNQAETFVQASDLYLSKNYGGRYDLSEILDDPSNSVEMISSIYLGLSPQIKDFFMEIGVSDGIKFIEKEKIHISNAPKEFIEFLKKKDTRIQVMSNINEDSHCFKPWFYLGQIDQLISYEFSKIFWRSVFENSYFQTLLNSQTVYYWSLAGKEQKTNIINYPLLKILGSKSVPTMNKNMECPSRLYSWQYKNIISNKDLLPAFDFRQIKIQDKSFEEILGIRQELNFIACLEVFKTKPSISFLREHQIWRDFIKYVKEEDRLLTEEEKGKLEEFLNTGYLPNQKGGWRIIQSLFVVDKNIDTGITKDPNLIHYDLAKIADRLKINVLSAADFKPEFKDPINEGVKELLLLRLKFISLLESPDNLEEKKQQLQDLVYPLRFFKTKKIELACHKTIPPIVNTEKQFLHLDDKVYYLRHWQSVNAVELFEFLGSLLNLKKVNKKTLIDLLILSEEDVVELLDEKNVSYPPEWKKTKIDESQNKASSLVTKESKKELINEVQEPASNYENGPDTVADGNSYNGHVIKVGISDTEKEGYEVPYSQEEEEAIMRVFGDNAPKDFRKDLNLAALIKGLSYLYHNGYDINEAEQNLIESHHYSQLHPVYKGGIAFTIKCRSAKSGLLYLKASAWKELEHPNIFLYSWIGPSFSDAKFCKSREEVIHDVKADYQVLRIEAKPSVSVLDSFMDGTMDLQEIMLIVRTKSKEEYRGIFEDIRKKSKSDSLETLNIGNEDDD